MQTNEVITSQYTALNFLFLNLWKQFKRPANVREVYAVVALDRSHCASMLGLLIGLQLDRKWHGSLKCLLFECTRIVVALLVYLHVSF